MKRIAVAIASTAASVALIAPMPALAEPATNGADRPDDTPCETWTHIDPSQHVRTSEREVAHVEGTFAFTQNDLTPNTVIASVFNKGAAALCDAATELTVSAPADWSIAVTGDVAHPFEATIEQLESGDATSTVMGCACASNGAGGLAAINAKIDGIPLAAVIDRAQPLDDAASARLICEDGHEIALPLPYIMQRKAVIATEINDESLSASVGGTNQLWIDSTAAKYFARNIVEIRVEGREVEAPGIQAETPGEYANRPNVGITASAS